MKILYFLRWLFDDYLLISYKNSDFIIQQKARVLSAIALATITVVICLLPLHIYLGFSIEVAFPLFIAMGVCPIVLGLVRKGIFSFAGHLIIVVSLAGIWFTLFVESGNIIMKLDTISYVLCAFTLLSLFEYRSKKIIFVYFAINVLLMFIFYHHIIVDFSVEADVALEYLIDNLVVLFFGTVICYQVVSINKNALDKANESIQIAHSETLKNQELAQTLEMKVTQRTKDLVNNNRKLQNEIKEKMATEAKLKETQYMLIDTAHKAGMAEIASDSLHNVGNILNSVKTSAFVIKDSVLNSPLDNYSLTCDLIRENQNDLKNFVTNDSKGQKLFEYYLKLEESFQSTFESINTNIDRLNSKIETINHVIVAQQNHARAAFLTEQLDVVEIIESALNILQELKINQDIKILKNYGDSIPLISLQKSKFLHILINLLKNAFQAMQSDTIVKKELSINVFIANDCLNIEISDTGQGIAEENLKRIFAHGFTTRHDGSGFGLHSCANYANEMGATIFAQSAGENQGASFHIKIPVQNDF